MLLACCLRSIAGRARSYKRRPVCDTQPMTIVLIAIALYLVAAGLLVSAVASDRLDSRRGWFWPALGGQRYHRNHPLRSKPSVAYLSHAGDSLQWKLT